MEEFDFGFQPSIDKKQINDAITCQYIREKRNLIFIGNPGPVTFCTSLLQAE